MRSDTLLEPAAVPDVPAVRDLLVLWQHPDTREILPIGRLSHEGGAYAFSYTRVAASIENFRPLPGLQDLYETYRNDRLPSVFGQRVMESDRPDYADYMTSLGLDPSRATPWEQIVHSGGGRAGDTLQFMQIPSVSGGQVCARFFANGIRHIPGSSRNVNGREIHVSAGEHESVLLSLEAGDRLLILPEIGNSQDEDAAFITKNGMPLGYIPRLLSESIGELLTRGPVEVFVVRLGSPGTPSHIRLVLDLHEQAPTGFEFDRNHRWEPLQSQ